MLANFRKGVWLAAALVVAISLTLGAILAHEGRPVGDYRFIVGWLEEPAYEGARNAVSVSITRSMDAGHETMNRMPGDEDSSSMSSGGDAMSGMSHDQGMHVEGLEGALQVEVKYVATGATKTFDLLAVFGEPGHYVAHMIPTAAGVYEFRVSGDIEGTPVDETFASQGGGGGFDDIRSSAGLQFPEELPEIREIESGVRGALQTAQEAQDMALAARESGGSAMPIVALIVGIAGAVSGVAGVYFGLAARRSQ